MGMSASQVGLENGCTGRCTGAAHPGLEQGDTGGLAQAPGQLAGLLHQHVRGDDRQVEGQQLPAPDSLRWVALAVVAQELPGGGRGKEDRIQEGARPRGLPGTAQVQSHLTRPRHRARGLPCPSLTQPYKVQPQAATAQPSGFLILEWGPLDGRAPSMGHTEPSEKVFRSPAETPANAASMCQQEEGQEPQQVPHSLPLTECLAVRSF